MMRALLIILALVPVAARSASGMLLPTSLEEFLDNAACVCVVEVTDVEEATADQLLALGIPESRLRGLNRLARLRVDRWIVEDQCAVPSLRPVLAFSTEVHSSKPETGRMYLVFPRPEGRSWTEATYGRSVWEITARDQVLITYRNEFLLAPLELRSGETALVPLAAVERVLTRTLGSAEP